VRVGVLPANEPNKGDGERNERQRNKSDLEMDDRMFASVRPRLVLVSDGHGLLPTRRQMKPPRHVSIERIV
jgi:hypothetical protein